MKKALRTVFVLLAFGCVIGALIMLTQPAAIKIDNDDFKYTLSEITFSCVKEPYSLDFSIINLIPIIMLFAGVIMVPFEVASIYIKQKEGKRKLSSTPAVIFVILLLIAAGVMVFYAFSFIVPALQGELSEAAKKTLTNEFRKTFREDYKLGAGIIGFAVFSFSGAALLIASLVMKFMTKE